MMWAKYPLKGGRTWPKVTEGELEDGRKLLDFTSGIGVAPGTNTQPARRSATAAPDSARLRPSSVRVRASR